MRCANVPFDIDYFITFQIVWTEHKMILQCCFDSLLQWMEGRGMWKTMTNQNPKAMKENMHSTIKRKWWLVWWYFTGNLIHSEWSARHAWIDFRSIEWMRHHIGHMGLSWLPTITTIRITKNECIQRLQSKCLRISNFVEIFTKSIDCIVRKRSTWNESNLGWTGARVAIFVHSRMRTYAYGYILLPYIRTLSR